jgi:hypothetical protein
MSMLTAVTSALATCTVLAWRDRVGSRPEARVDHEIVDQCQVAIVLVGRDEESIVSRTIDDATGALGFSHLLLDPCRVDGAGERQFVDYTSGRGVHWTTLEPYRHRRIVSIPLPEPLATEVWGCTRARLGQPMNVQALALGIEQHASCVGLIVSCLPWSMQRELHKRRVGPCVSPNTIALAYGVH